MKRNLYSPALTGLPNLPPRGCKLPKIMTNRAPTHVDEMASSHSHKVGHSQGFCFSSVHPLFIPFHRHLCEAFGNITRMLTVLRFPTQTLLELIPKSLLWQFATRIYETRFKRAGWLGALGVQDGLRRYTQIRRSAKEWEENGSPAFLFSESKFKTQSRFRKEGTHNQGWPASAMAHFRQGFTGALRIQRAEMGEGGTQETGWGCTNRYGKIQAQPRAGSSQPCRGGSGSWGLGI